MSDRRAFIQTALGAAAAAVLAGTYAFPLDAVKSGDIPDGWMLYQIGGQSLFPIYGASGGICAAMCAYLVKNPHSKETQAIGVGFTDLEFHAVAHDEASIRRLIEYKFKKAVSEGKITNVNMNGGNLPLPQFFNA